MLDLLCVRHSGRSSQCRRRRNADRTPRFRFTTERLDCTHRRVLLDAARSSSKSWVARLTLYAVRDDHCVETRDIFWLLRQQRRQVSKNARRSRSRWFVSFYVNVTKTEEREDRGRRRTALKMLPILNMGWPPFEQKYMAQVS